MKIKILKNTGGPVDSFATFKKGQVCSIISTDESQYLTLKEEGNDRVQLISTEIFRRWLREQKIIIVG